MGSKAFVLLGLLLATVVLITSEVTARDLVESTSTPKETTDQYGGGGCRGGGCGGGRCYGHRCGGNNNGGGGCQYGCCGHGNGGCRRCCSYEGEPVDKED